MATLHEVLASARSREFLRDITLGERVALDVANHNDYVTRCRWRDAMRGALFSAKLDRETARECMRLGMPDAAKVAREDAAERELRATEIRTVLELFSHPPDFWTEPSFPSARRSEVRT